MERFLIVSDGGFWSPNATETDSVEIPNMQMDLIFDNVFIRALTTSC